MKYKNGWAFDDGQVYQTDIPDTPTLHDIPEIYKFHFIKTQILKDFSRSYAFNTATQKEGVTADLQRIKKTKILIPLHTINNNFVHGAAPRFPQIWRRDDDGKS